MGGVQGVGTRGGGDRVVVVQGGGGLQGCKGMDCGRWGNGVIGCRRWLGRGAISSKGFGCRVFGHSG